MRVLPIGFLHHLLLVKWKIKKCYDYLILALARLLLYEFIKIKNTIIIKGKTIVFWRTAIPKLMRIYADGMLNVKIDKKENQKNDLYR